MIFGLCGYARSGKDTVGEILVDLLEWGTRFSFADELKSELRQFVFDNYGWDVFDLNDAQKKIIRPLLIAHGQARRAIDENCWIDKLILEIDNYGGENSVITDVRFENELEWVKKERGISIWIKRQGVGPVGEEEAEFTSPLLEQVDYIWEMPEVINLEDLEPFVKKKLEECLNN